jgi:YD repeat-containing protein
VGNRLDMTVTNSSGVRKHVYSYDDIYQITGVNYPPELSYLATDTTFNYDAAGNRTSVIDGSGTCNYTTNNLNQYTAAGTTNFYYDASGNMVQDAHCLYTYDPENRLTEVWKPDPPTQNLNNFSAYTQGGDAPWVTDPYGFAQSGALDDGYENGQESWMYIDVQGPGTVAFKWKVSSEVYCDGLEFYVDDDYRWGNWGEWENWNAESITITGSGTHRLKWRYYKDSSGSYGDDCGWIKDVNFTPAPPPEPDHLAEATDSGLVYTTGGDAPWAERWEDPYHGSSLAASEPIDDSQEAWGNPGSHLHLSFNA